MKTELPDPEVGRELYERVRGSRLDLPAWVHLSPRDRLRWRVVAESLQAEGWKP